MFGTYRCILALFVVIGHILGMRHSAGAAVFSFYMLSGFLMTHIMVERYNNGTKSFFAFCYHRFLRLFPMYWIALIIGIVAILVAGEDKATLVNVRMFMPETVKEWLYNIFIVSPSLFPLEFKPRIVSPAWALTVEIFYYLLIALGISKNKTWTWIWLGGSIVYYLSTYYMGYDFGWRSKGLLCASLPFSLGSLLYYYRSSFPKLGRNLSAKVGVVVAYSIISIISYVILDFTDPKWADLLLNVSLIPSALALVILYPPLKNQNIRSKKIDDQLGGLSYPFYVLHWPMALCAVSWFKLNPELGLTKDGIIAFCIIIVGMTVVGVVFENVAEPQIRKLRRLIK